MNRLKAIKNLPTLFLPLFVFFLLVLFKLDLFSPQSSKIFLGFLLSFVLALSLIPFYGFFKFSVKQKWDHILPYFVVGFGFVVYSIFGLFNHFHFNTHAYDFGFFDQVVWKISLLKVPSSSIIFVQHFLTDHFQPILYLLSPLYWIYNNPVTLILFEILIVCLGALPIFWLTKKKFESNFLPTVLSLAYVFFVGNQFAIAFTFHPSTLFATLFLFAFYFFEEKKYFWHFVFIILALMLKENVGLYVAALGIFYLIQKKLVGFVHLVLGGIWFILAWRILPPLFGKVVGNHYEYFTLGENPLEALRTLFIRPLYSLFLLFNNPMKVQMFLILFASFGFLSFLSPIFLVIFFPMLGERFFSVLDLRWLMGFHYSAPMSAILVLSTIYGLVYLNKNIKFPWESFAGTFLLVNVVVMTYLTQAPLHNLVMHPSFYKATPKIQSADKALKLIPKKASVSAQEDFVPHLAHRDDISEYPYNAELSSYIFLDVEGNIYPLTEESYPKYLNMFLQNPNYGIKFNENSIIVFERNLKSDIKPSQEVIDVSKGIFER